MFDTTPLQPLPPTSCDVHQLLIMIVIIPIAWQNDQCHTVAVGNDVEVTVPAVTDVEVTVPTE